MEIERSLGGRIKFARKSKNLSQLELSTHIGRSVSALQRYENNIKNPPSDVLLKLAEKLGTSVDYLLTGFDRYNSTGSYNMVRENPEVYNFDGKSIYIPVIYEMYDESNIDSIAVSHNELILVERTKLSDNFNDYFALRFNTYYDDFHQHQGGAKSTFIIHRQNKINSGELGYIQYEGIPMIGRIFLGKSVTSILTSSMSENRIEIQHKRLEDLIILGRVIFTIQEY